MGMEGEWKMENEEDGICDNALAANSSSTTELQLN
jgi:hypothetical protein